MRCTHSVSNCNSQAKCTHASADNNRICKEEVPKLVYAYWICKPVDNLSWNKKKNILILRKSRLVRRICITHIWAPLLKKVPYDLSRCHTKRRTGAAPKKIKNFQKKNFKKNLKSRCHTKRRVGSGH